MSDKSHLPMLAKNWDPKKTVYPCVVQPKLDGVRCLAHFTEEGVVLRSRDNKPLTMPHVVKQLEKLSIPVGTILDGELYEHGVPFQELVGNIRRELDDERKRSIPYWIYDVMDSPEGVHERQYQSRNLYLSDLIPPYFSKIKLLPFDYIAVSEQHVRSIERQFVTDGYEGAMIRTHKKVRATKKNPDPEPIPDFYQAAYHGHSRRSDFLQKVKTFDDDEAVIVGVEEEIALDGTPKRRASKFRMRDAHGTVFCASGLTDEMKEDAWMNPDSYIGKTATYKFFGRSNEGVPRHPNFKALRPEGKLDAAV